MRTRKVSGLPVVGADGAHWPASSTRARRAPVLGRDADIARQVRDLMTEVLLADPADITVHVHDGVVAVSRQLRPEGRICDLTPVALRLIWDIDGVVNVVNQLGAAS